MGCDVFPSPLPAAERSAEDAAADGVDEEGGAYLSLLIVP